MVIFFAGDVDKAGRTIGVSLTKHGATRRLVSFYAIRREQGALISDWLQQYVKTGILIRKKK